MPNAQYPIPTMCKTNIQAIYIKCPTAINLQQIYNAPPDWFALINNEQWLRIFVTPEEYVTLREGEAPRYSRAFGRPFYPLKLKETGFIITLAEDNDKLRDILEEIIEASISLDKKEHIPIQVLDYVKPERADKKQKIANQSNPFTLRKGMIALEPGNGTSGFQADRYTVNGIRFTFRQITLAL